MIDVLLRPVWGRRLAADAPMLTEVAEAFIDGNAVQWAAAERRACTPSERQMMRQLRAVALFGTAAAAGPGVATGTTARPQVRRRTAMAVADAGAMVARAWASLFPVSRRGGTSAIRLARLATDLQRARSPRELAMALTAHLRAALDAPTVAIVVPDGPGWTTLAGNLPPVRCDSAVAALLDSADDAIDVGRGSRVYELLPPADREWLAIARVSALVRLASKDGRTLAGLLVGAAPVGRRHDRRDRTFLAAAARVAALAMDAITPRSDTPRLLAADQDLAFECQSCGEFGPSAERCPCGGIRHLAALPACLHGTFRLEKRIGAGGMGVVYLARDLRLDRRVALKTLPTLSSGRASTLRDEARAMATLAHPSVSVLYGLEEWRGTPVLVTEYLAGGTLAARLAAGPVPLADALAIGASVADALAALHARGWQHRDVKPANIGFCDNGTPKLLDFGLTRWCAAADQAWSPLAGTPLYLSPELLDGEPATARDDVWALALVILEMIAGAGALQAVCRTTGRQQQPPVDVVLSRLAPAVPLGLRHVLTTALHPALPQRLVEARLLAAALRAAGTAA